MTPQAWGFRAPGSVPGYAPGYASDLCTRRIPQLSPRARRRTITFMFCRMGQLVLVAAIAMALAGCAQEEISRTRLDHYGYDSSQFSMAPGPRKPGPERQEPDAMKKFSDSVEDATAKVGRGVGDVAKKTWHEVTTLFGLLD